MNYENSSSLLSYLLINLYSNNLFSFVIYLNKKNKLYRSTLLIFFFDRHRKEGKIEEFIRSLLAKI